MAAKPAGNRAPAPPHAGRGPDRRIRPATERSLAVRLVAGLTAVGGVLSLLSALPLFAPRIDRLTRVMNPLVYRVGRETVALVIGVTLLYLAGNLARRKRAAWLLATVLFGVSALAQGIHVVVAGPTVVRPAGSIAHLGFPVVMVGVLVVNRRHFFARPDPPTLFQFLRFVPLYVGAVYVYGFATIHLAARAVDPSPTWGRTLRTITEAFVGIDGEYTYRGRALATVFPASLTLLGAVGVAIAIVLVFRPIVGRPRGHDDLEQARDLVRRYGGDSLSYFALRPDKSYFFGSDGQAMIAYAYLGRYALASGDPIGHPDSIDLVIDEFVAMCRDHGWGHAFLAVREDDVERYLRRGLRSFYLGDEAVIECDSFTLEGKKNKSMRQSVQRVARTYRLEMVAEADAAPELAAALNALSDRWRGRAPERGFTMALSVPVGTGATDHVLCVALDEHDQPGGFLRIVPIFGDDPGYTLDMMRRDPTAPNGMTEFLLANTAFALRDRGMRRLSMNFAVMGRLFADDLAFTRRQRLLRRVVTLLNPFFQIKSLHDFNRRFRPRWVPRAIVYEDQRTFPRVALLYSGVEGFLALPLVGRYFVPRRHEPLPDAAER